MILLAGNAENYILCGIHIDWVKVHYKIIIQLIQCLVNFRKVQWYADTSVISFILFYFLEGFILKILVACYQNQAIRRTSINRKNKGNLMFFRYWFHNWILWNYNVHLHFIVVSSVQVYKISLRSHKFFLHKEL